MIVEGMMGGEFDRTGAARAVAQRLGLETMPVLTQLRRWERAGILFPSGVGRQRVPVRYRERDVLRATALMILQRGGLTAAEIRTVVTQIGTEAVDELLREDERAKQY